MLKFFRLPFASSGDKTAIPDAVDANGNVSYTQGYGFDYQRAKTDPAAKNIERDRMNQLFFDVTNAISETQGQGVPDYITSALNGGTPYSYRINAECRYADEIYLSLVANNTALPTDTTKWAKLPTPALIQQGAYTSVAAGGTSDAITAAILPAITSLANQLVFVRATAANMTTTPTINFGFGAVPIVKGGSAGPTLAAGDIAGAGYWMILKLDQVLGKAVLLNPNDPTPALFDNDASRATTAFVQRALGNFSTFGYYAASATLPLSALGSGIQLAGGTPGQIYELPSVTAVAAGGAFTITSFASVPVTLKASGAEAIISSSFAPGGANTFIIYPDETVTVVCNAGANWNVFGAANGLGIGQHYVELVASRLLSTTYTNTDHRPRAVSVTLKNTLQAHAQMTVTDPYTGGVTVITGSGSYSTYDQACNVSAIVPPRHTYLVNSNVGTPSLVGWQELKL